MFLWNKKYSEVIKKISNHVMEIRNKTFLLVNKLKAYINETSKVFVLNCKKYKNTLVTKAYMHDKLGPFINKVGKFIKKKKKQIKASNWYNSVEVQEFISILSIVEKKAVKKLWMFWDVKWVFIAKITKFLLFLFCLIVVSQQLHSFQVLVFMTDPEFPHSLEAPWWWVLVYGENCHLKAPVTLVAQTLREFYILLLYVILFIFGTILYQTVVAIIYSNKNWKKGPNLTFKKNYRLEFLWSLIPAIFLVLLTIPSFATLYYAEYNHPKNSPLLYEDEIWYNMRCVKVEGSQWYWTYEYSQQLKNKAGFNNKEFGIHNICESRLVGNMSKDFIYKYGNFSHLNSVSHELLLELKKVTKIVVTSLDVLHSFSVPQFGIKIDAIPGQLNNVYVKPEISGYFFGQCSELCGVGHALMPIVVKVSIVDLPPVHPQQLIK